MNVSPNKWMLMNNEGAMMWVRERTTLTNAMEIGQRVYLKDNDSSEAVDFRVRQNYLTT